MKINWRRIENTNIWEIGKQDGKWHFWGSASINKNLSVFGIIIRGLFIGIIKGANDS